MKRSVKELYTEFEKAFKRALFLLLRLLFRNKPLSVKPKASEIKRTLLLRYDRIGDMIITLPTIEYLHQINPSMRIDVLASASNAIIVQHDPHVSNVYIMPTGFWKTLSLLLRLRSQHYDLIVACLFAKSTVIGLIANVIGGARALKATLHRGDKYDVLFNMQSKTAQMQASGVAKNAFIIPDAIDTDVVPDCMTVMYVSEEARHRVRTMLSNLHIEERNYIVLNISVRTPRNGWIDEGFARVMDHIHSQYNVVPVICSMPHDYSRAEALLRGRPWAHLFPRTDNVLDVAALIDTSLFVVSPDTAVVHMCSALHVPLVGLYVGDSVGIGEWGPQCIEVFEVVESENKLPVSSVSADRVNAAIDRVYARLRSSSAPTSTLKSIES